jgi:hypothetical protein
MARKEAPCRESSPVIGGVGDGRPSDIAGSSDVVRHGAAGREGKVVWIGDEDDECIAELPTTGSPEEVRMDFCAVGSDGPAIEMPSVPNTLIAVLRW